MLKNLVIIIAATVLMISCNSNTNSNDKDISIEKIAKLEGEIFGNSSMTIPDAAKAEELVDMYILYANQNPTDSIAPKLLYKAADISMNFRAPVRSISLLNRIINEYPNFENMPTAMFLKGFIYDDQLADYTNARKSYMDFLERFPDSEFADDAKLSLKNLGKTPEQLIKEFEKNK